MSADYDRRAESYDATRSASPSVIGPLLDALGPPDGRSLLDIGGGTGNYAVALGDAGFRVTVVDLSVEMLRRAAEKLGSGAVVQGDALHLPLRASAFDCAASVNVSHHVPDWRLHIAEAKRVVGQGTFAMQVNTRENIEAHWIFEYFPGAKEATLAHHPPAAEVISEMKRAGFRAVQRRGFVFEDRRDATFEALKHWPESYLEGAYRRNTTFFRRLGPAEEREGIARLERDYRSGALDGVVVRYAPLLSAAGDSTVFVGSGRSGS